MVDCSDCTRTGISKLISRCTLSSWFIDTNELTSAIEILHPVTLTWNSMTLLANFDVKRNNDVLFDEIHQLRLVVWELVTLGNLEDGVDKHFWGGTLEYWVIPLNHG